MANRTGAFRSANSASQRLRKWIRRIRVGLPIWAIGQLFPFLMSANPLHRPEEVDILYVVFGSPLGLSLIGSVFTFLAVLYVYLDEKPRDDSSSPIQHS